MYILKLTISTKGQRNLQAVAVDKTMELDGLLAVFGINANNSVSKFSDNRRRITTTKTRQIVEEPWGVHSRYNSNHHVQKIGK